MAKKVLSYFYTRAINELDLKSPYEIDEDLLDKFLLAIEHQSQNEVSNWSCWESREHFLIYHYHHDVMKKLITKKGSAKGDLV
ncbi:hypothetical protein [Paenibacillus gansuensis]|uniref:Uncharacterized protein n=1 Tax=Paenibacillus gansuensis TaxID=306542 RepID=A0ABW5PL94_9BACL